MPYDCPHCGAIDSTRCVFPITAVGEVRKDKQDEAHSVGCRVQHYTDIRHEVADNA